MRLKSSGVFTPHPGMWYEGKCIPPPNVALVISDDDNGEYPFIGSYIGDGAWSGRYPEDTTDVSYTTPKWWMVIPPVR